ncbi:MAG: hypothetical protein H7Y59_04100 [Anaerolineales bacterium]|nr:hypothetical protein [Anaerolineales bacterium]
MSRIESAISVTRSIEDVFTFLSKRESHLNFIPRMIKLTQTSQGDFGRVGSTADGMLNYFGIKIPVQYEIIEHESINKLAMKGLMGPVSFKDGYILSKRADSTEIKFWLELNPTGWTKIFTPFMGLIGKVHAWETLRNLKREIQK